MKNLFFMVAFVLLGSCENNENYDIIDEQCLNIAHNIVPEIKNPVDKIEFRNIYEKCLDIYLDEESN